MTMWSEQLIDEKYKEITSPTKMNLPLVWVVTSMHASPLKTIHQN